MNYAKFTTILAILAIGGASLFSIRHYSSPEYLTARYQAEMESISGALSTLRAEREKTRIEWEKQDSSLSGQINNHKARLELLRLCIEAESVRCSDEKKESYHLINSTYANEVNTSPPSDQSRSSVYRSYSPPTTLAQAEGLRSDVQNDEGHENTRALSSGGMGENGAKTEGGSKEVVVPRFDLSGSHDYRIYAKSYPGVAGWKNNNPTGLTYRASRDLEHLWDLAGVSYGVGTARPRQEGGNYYNFLSIEHGLQASIISKKERWKKATVRQFLAGWGTDQIGGGVPLDKKIGELTEWEFNNLFIHQMKKESPGLVSQLVKDGILIVE